MRPLFTGLLIASLALSPRAYADASPPDRAAAAAADALFADAGKLAAANRWGEACLKLEASLKLDPGIGTLMRLGYCYEKIGRNSSAWSSYNDAIGMAQRANDKRAKDATEGAKRLEPTLARLTIEVAPENAGAGLEIRRDGTSISTGALGTPIPVDPGVHVLAATQPGKQAWTTTITIEAKPGVTTVRVPALVTVAEPAAAAAALPATAVAALPVAEPASVWGAQRIAGVSVGGVGVAGVIVGAVFGGLTGKKVADSKATCTPDLRSCRQPGYDLQHEARTTANVSDAAFAIGGAAVIAGVVLVVTAPRGHAAPAAKSSTWVTVGPVAGAELRGVLVRGGF